MNVDKVVFIRRHTNISAAFNDRGKVAVISRAHGEYAESEAAILHSAGSADSALHWDYLIQEVLVHGWSRRFMGGSQHELREVADVSGQRRGGRDP